MNNLPYLTALILSLFALSCSQQGNSKNDQVQAARYRLEKTNFKLKVNSSFRGLCVVDKNVVWASGSNGTFIKTVDGGQHWTVDSIPGASQLDFRDIEAFNKDTALLMNAGFPGKIYKTTDGGKSWTVTYENNHPAVFLDGFDFWDEKRGVAFGDPIEGKLLIIWTIDGGDSWKTVTAENLPEQLPMEAGFAASGTGIVTWAGNKVIIGLGGTKARVFTSILNDQLWDAGNRSWVATETPVISGNAARGIYSLCFGTDKEGIAVGGAWNEDSLTHTSAYTVDMGQHWQPGEGREAYRSACCFVKDHTYLATGPSGTDITRDGGKSWETLDPEGFNAIEYVKAGQTGFAVGSEGKVVGLKLVKE